jgi:hypothetical protein
MEPKFAPNRLSICSKFFTTSTKKRYFENWLFLSVKWIKKIMENSFYEPKNTKLKNIFA